MEKKLPRRFKPKRDPSGAVQLVIDGCKLALWVPWALVWGATGLALCVTVIGIPLGVVSFGIGAWPLQRMVETRNYRVVSWEDDELEAALRRATHGQELPPWLMDEEEE